MFKNFKKIGIVCLVLVAMAAFSSCSKPEKQIIGKWKITGASIKNNGHELEGEFDDIGGKWVFKENEWCVLHILGQDFEGHYAVKDNTLAINVEHFFIEYDEEACVTSSALDIDEINKEEMSISGTIYVNADNGNWTKCKLSFEFEKK